MALRINIPPLTRILIVLVIGLSLLYQLNSFYMPSPAGIPYLAIVPAKSIRYPWVFISASLTEENVVSLFVAAATLLFGGKYLERAWGSLEYGKVLLAVAFVPNVITTLIYVTWTALFANSQASSITIQGSVSVQIAFLVAFKQLVPEHTVTILKGIIRIRVKHFPALFLFGNTISGIALGTDTALVLAWLGFITCWTYLRFYKRQPDLTEAGTGGLVFRGDASETFAFAYFWPDAIHQPVAAVSDRVHNVLVSLRICTPFNAEDVALSNVHAVTRGEGGLPSLFDQGGRREGGMSEEAERRRALALKALDDRLQAANMHRIQPTPGIPPGAIAQATTSEHPVADALKLEEV